MSQAIDSQNNSRGDGIVSRFYQLPSGKLRVWTGGNGPAILLLHGAWSDSSMHWRAVWTALSQRFRVIAPDLPGFGESQALREPSVPRMSRLFVELLDLLQVDRAVVIGNSFGVAVAQGFTAIYPERVSRLILVNGNTPPVIPAFLRRFLRIPPVYRLISWLWIKLIYSPLTIQGSFANPARNLSRSQLDEISANAKRYARIAIECWLRYENPITPTYLPTMVVAGTEDRLAPVEQMEEFSRGFPNVRFVTIAGAGHLPQVEQPQAFVDAVTDFASIRERDAKSAL